MDHSFLSALVLLLLLPPTFASLAAFATLYGAANGILTIVRGIAVPEMLTREAYGAVNGALAASSTLSGPSVGGPAGLTLGKDPWSAGLVGLLRPRTRSDPLRPTERTAIHLPPQPRRLPRGPDAAAARPTLPS